MKPALVLSSNTAPGVTLESINDSHLELLRRLKNHHRRRFFHQDEISAEQQQQWFAAYSTRADDWMFIARRHDVIEACIGYRTVDSCIDIYNFIREDNSGPKTDFAHNVFDLICSFAAESTGLPIRGRVLEDNPFLPWIQKHGFAIIARGLEAGLPYCLLEQDPRLRVKHSVTVKFATQSSSNLPAGFSHE